MVWQRPAGSHTVFDAVAVAMDVVEVAELGIALDDVAVAEV